MKLLKDLVNNDTYVIKRYFSVVTDNKIFRFFDNHPSWGFPRCTKLEFIGRLFSWDAEDYSVIMERKPVVK
jgi:hypothetical protein